MFFKVACLKGVNKSELKDREKKRESDILFIFSKTKNEVVKIKGFSKSVQTLTTGYR